MTTQGICKTCRYCLWLGERAECKDEPDNMEWVKCSRPEKYAESKVEAGYGYDEPSSTDDSFLIWSYTDADVAACTLWESKVVTPKRKKRSGSTKSKMRRKMGSVSKVRHKTGRKG